MLRPKLLTTLRHYSFDQFVSDLTAGLIVGIVALPLAIAFAIASGVSPERGLFTAIVADAICSSIDKSGFLRGTIFAKDKDMTIVLGPLVKFLGSNIRQRKRLGTTQALGDAMFDQVVGESPEREQ